MPLIDKYCVSISLYLKEFHGSLKLNENKKLNKVHTLLIYSKHPFVLSFYKSVAQIHDVNIITSDELFVFQLLHDRYYKEAYLFAHLTQRINLITSWAFFS